MSKSKLKKLPRQEVAVLRVAKQLDEARQHRWNRWRTRSASKRSPDKGAKVQISPAKQRGAFILQDEMLD